MQTRRKFLQAVSTSGLVLLAADTAQSGKIRDLGDGRASYSIPLRDGWEFRVDADGSTTPSDAIDGADGWQPVQAPHTWQSLGRSPEHVGMASYRLRFQAPANWAS